MALVEDDPPEQFAEGVGDAAMGESGLGVGEVFPGVVDDLAHAGQRNREGQAGVGAAGFEQQDTESGALGQPVGEDAARGAASGNDVIPFAVGSHVRRLRGAAASKTNPAVVANWARSTAAATRVAWAAAY